MPSKAYNTMTIDELEQESASLKREILNIRDERRKIAEVRNRKVHEWHYDEAVKQLTKKADDTDRTVEQVALDWIDDGDRGHYIQAKLFLDRKASEKKESK